jgi:hypothetical protein
MKPILTFLLPIIIGSFALICSQNFVAYDLTLLNLVNNVRKENDLQPVKFNKKLAKSSLKKACDMNEKHYIAHTSPDGKLWEFIKDTDYHFVIAGENLGQGCTDEGCVTLWMNSAKHKAIILDPRYKEGAVSRCGDSVALHFGVRLTVKQRIQIMIFRLKAILRQEKILRTTNT